MIIFNLPFPNSPALIDYLKTDGNGNINKVQMVIDFEFENYLGEKIKFKVPVNRNLNKFI